MALTKESIANQTKQVTQLWILIILITALIAIGGPALISFISTPNDGFCKMQDLTTLECGNIQAFDEGNGLVGFSVEFHTPYHRGFVNKTPIVEGERIVRIGPNVFWHGSYNISQKTAIPKPALTFERADNTDPREVCRKPHVYTVSCPNLEETLKKSSLKKKTAKISDIKTKDYKLSQDLEVYKCRNVKVYEPIEYLGAVDYSVVFDLPHGMEGTNITKYPMFKGEQFVFTGKEVHWYGSATQYGGEGLANSTLVFQRLDSTDIYYFDLSCPELQNDIQEIFDDHWSSVKWLAYLGAFFAILVASGIAFSLGLCCGDCMARSAVRELL